MADMAGEALGAVAALGKLAVAIYKAPEGRVMYAAPIAMQMLPIPYEPEALCDKIGEVCDALYLAIVEERRKTRERRTTKRKALPKRQKGA